MHTPLRSPYRHTITIVVLAAIVVVLPGFDQPTQARQAADEAKPTIQIPPGATVGSLFKDFMHYARIGRFTLADAYARTMFAHPEFDAVTLVRIADKDAKTVEILTTLIRRSSIADTAARVLDALELGEREKRKDPERILKNIDLLGGDPQQEFFARKYLRESGEYGIPLMIDALLDRSKKRLWPRVITALPFIGKQAVNPLVIALRMRNNDVRLNLIAALGEIGYPQAIPYLRQLVATEAMPQETKGAALAAIARIEQLTGRTFPGSAQDAFVDLAQRYYEEDNAVSADPRIDNANVWRWNGNDRSLRRVVVPQRIYGQVMAMRCAEEALMLQNDNADAIALWLAANIRREHRLGLNVENADPEQTGDPDATRPDVFPRALYFTQSAGPRYAHLVLERTIRDQDAAVSLGAIAALRVTAGESSLIGTEDYKQPLVAALQFPDLVVRTRAALTLAGALPRSGFTGAEHVIPILATTLGQTGREQVLVAANDEAEMNRVAGTLRDADRDTIAERNFFDALERARIEFQSLAGVFLSTDIVEPGVSDALQRLREEFMFAKTPVVLLTQPSHEAMAGDIARMDPYLETVDADANGDAIERAFARVRARTGQARFDRNVALELALQAAETLRRVAVDGRTIYDVTEAEPALIAALAAENERLQTLAASVLALMPSPTAQRAVAHVALNDTNTESLRVAAFGSLAESAKDNGKLIEQAQVDALVAIAGSDANLVIRTAASQALGAMNLATSKASEIIRSFHNG